MAGLELVEAAQARWLEPTASPQHVALVNMPFAVTDRPSIQCATLKAVLVAAGHTVDVHYFNLHLAAVLGAATYHRIAAPRRQGLLLGEWLFAEAAFDDAPPAADYVAATPELADIGHELGLTVEELVRLRHAVLPSLVDGWADAVDWSSYRVVGFTSTFEQHTAALALGRRVKARAPDARLVLGGANLDGEMGPAHAVAWEWIDAIVVGEGEEALCHIVERAGRDQPLAGIAGVVTRDERGLHDGGRAPGLTDLDALPDPDFDDYFSTLFSLGAERVMTAPLPQLLFESARGCWWGQRHHCTFCGLNAEGMTFRSKSPERVVAELGRLANRYHLLQFEAVDNIMDARYVAQVWRPLAEQHRDYSLFYEVKANLSRDQLRTMAAAGVRSIQPGIESLSTHVLGLMRKGSTLLQNLRLLKWAQYYGIGVRWNLLCGFPGEHVDDYDGQAGLVPLISHLPPPGGIGPIWLERFSPYFADHSFPVHDVEPEAAYRFVYPPGRVDVDRIAYFFSYRMDDVVDPGAVDGLREAVATWQARWACQPAPALAYQRGPDWMKIVDRRDPARTEAFALHDEEAIVYELCGETAAAVPDLATALRERGAPATACRTATIVAWLTRARDAGLVVEENERYFALAHPIGHW